MIDDQIDKQEVIVETCRAWDFENCSTAMRIERKRKSSEFEKGLHTDNKLEVFPGLSQVEPM